MVFAVTLTKCCFTGVNSYTENINGQGYSAGCTCCALFVFICVYLCISRYSLSQLFVLCVFWWAGGRYTTVAFLCGCVLWKQDRFGVLIGSGIGGVEFFEDNCAKFNKAGGGAAGAKKVRPAPRFRSRFVRVSFFCLWQTKDDVTGYS